MSFLAASRQLGSAVTLWTLAKNANPLSQLRAVSMFHHCSHSSQHQSDSKRINNGSRDYSRPAYTDSENVEEYEKKTHDRTKSKANSLKFQKKLHKRVFTEPELADNRMFRNQQVVSESEDDVFGSLQQRRETNKVSDHSLGLNSESSFQNKALDTTDSAPEGKTAHGTFGVNKHIASRGKINQLFAQESRLNKQNRRWGDEFGTLSEDSIADRIEESLRTAIGSHEERFSGDEDEERKHIRLSTVNRRRIPEWYGRRILKLGKRGQVREAIEVLEDWMLKEDRVKPNVYVFTCLLTVLGRAGYTKKAFSVFRKMRSMGIQPKPATYTALFNACANSPWKKDGQARADNLARIMKEKEVRPTFITGKAMVKAFAMCGDLRRAFSLVDELSQVYRPDPEIFSFLLMACISDKEAGLRHAIQVWQVMQQMGVQPDRPLYNLLLRCVRDCRVGDMPSFTALLTGGAATSQLDAGSAQQTASLPLDSKADTDDFLDIKGVEQSAEFDSSFADCGPASPHSEVLNTEGHGPQPESNSHFRNPEVMQKSQDDSQDVQNIRSQSELALHSPVTVPDVLSPKCSNSAIVSLGDLSTKENRLLLLGGVEGILSRMSKDEASPDVITFTHLVSVALPTVEAEQQLLDAMKAMKVKPDTDFMNTLIHKRCMRADYDAAKAVKEMMVDYGLTANQMTYGVLAMTCKTQQDAVQLLEDMEAADMMPNMEILGSLMYASGLKFGYKLWVLRQAQQLDLLPNTKFLRNVENSLATVRRKMIYAEKQGQTHSYLLSPAFQRSVETFTQHYESWLKQTQVEVPHHPWTNFKPPSEDKTDSAST